MIFLQGAARPDGVAAACFAAVDLQLVELCLSKDIVAEVRDVLFRAELRRKFSSLTDELVDQFLKAARSRAFWISEPPRVFTLDLDPKDEPYLNLALASEADFLVSRDRDILDLAHPNDADGKRLRALSPKLRVVEPLEFLREVHLGTLQ